MVEKYQLGVYNESQQKKTGFLMGLSQKSCEPCKGGVLPLSVTEAEKLIEDVHGWKLVNEARAIKRSYEFDNFVDALDFVNKIGELAESQQHHPDISLGWGYVDVLIYTHKISGLHENDFILALKINDIKSTS